MKIRIIKHRIFIAAFSVVAVLLFFVNEVNAMANRIKHSPLKIAVFSVDATPPIGSPLVVAPARTIEDRLSARGIILFSDGKPIVLCAVDALEVSNTGLDQWRKSLAEAAETSIERVTVHALHQHDAPRYDFATEAIMAAHGCKGKYYDTEFGEDVIERTAKAVGQACKKVGTVTHIGYGKAKVEKVASNRRVIIDGKCGPMRGSSCKDPNLIAAPEGVIDPYLRMVTFWDGDEPLASLMYYATHPMSHYGKGNVSSDFVGLAREQRQQETGVFHVYFTGAGGNIAAGKYNDGSPRMRPILTQRMATAMKQAWDNQQKQPIAGSDIQWRVKKVVLPLSEYIHEDELMAKIKDADCSGYYFKREVSQLAWLNRSKTDPEIDLSCLQLGKDVYILHMPGELFVEYQLAAQKIRSVDMVCMAAYGQRGMSYIGTEKAYEEGGYEVEPRSSFVAPEIEQVLLDAMRELLCSYGGPI